MIKIISGWSNPGGSTVAFINLCNLFNERGLDCTFYGPHHWHIDKCESGRIGETCINEEGEHLILHYIKLPERPKRSKSVTLACHEKSVFPIKGMTPFWDNIVYVSKSQKEWQGIDGTVIPNLAPPLLDTGINPPGVAGVIGTLSKEKQTHTSIKRALSEGYKEVLLYGNILYGNSYFKEYVEPLLSSRVIYKGMVLDKQLMYDSVSVVYQSSVPNYETFGLTKMECVLTGTDYKGNKDCNIDIEILSDNVIYEKWMGIINAQ